MLSFLRFSTAFAALAICGSGVHAYVVIDNFDAGAEALGAVASGVDATRDRATGVVKGDQSDRISTDKSLLFPTSKSRRSGKSSSSRSSGRTMLSYRSTSSRNAGGSASGSGSSGGGGGSSRGRGSSSSRRAFNQPIVDVSTPLAQPSHPNHDRGMNVAHFDGSNVGNGKGSSSGGKGGSGGKSGHEPTNPGPNTNPGPPDNGHLCPVSGTPEPAAFVVWAIAGCCGYGFLRFSQRLPLK